MNCKHHAAALRERLKKNHLKATPARLELLDVFEHQPRPLSVGQIAGRLKRPGVDKATLYRNVESLERLGLLKKISLGDRRGYYELAGGKHHHHLICKLCGKVRDVADCRASVGAAAVRRAGFAEILDHSLEFYGICAACSRKR
jgi:Fe2+ or Zn2+ uptake regulation protein